LISGIASSTLVTRFWKAYVKQYSDLTKFVDPAQATWTSLIVAAIGLCADIVYPSAQILNMFGRWWGFDELQKVFYVPMMLAFIFVTTDYLYTTYRVVRTVNTVKSRRTMVIYLVFCTASAGALLWSFILLVFGKGMENETAFSIFLLFLGRVGSALCNVSVFSAHPAATESSSHSDSASIFLIDEAERMANAIRKRDERIAQLEEGIFQAEKDFALADARSRWKIEEQARKHQEMLVEKEKNFVASALHEIRNPLNGIACSLDFIFESLSPMLKLVPAIEEELRVISSCSTHLNVLLRSVLSLDKLLQGKLALPIESFSPRDVLIEVERMSASAVNTGTVVVNDTPGNWKDGRVMGSPTQLSLVLLNLVNNAAKFTETGQITLACKKVKESKEDGTITVRLSVADTGAGIPLAMQHAIFGFREQTGDARARSKGFGIGLSVSRRLVELLGGELKVKSPLREADGVGGVGSEFSFELTMKKVIEEGQCEHTEDREHRTTAITELSTREWNAEFQLQAWRVLVVDDGNVNRKMFQRKFTTGIFGELGWTADSARTGEEAMEMIWGGSDGARIYDLIVLDEYLEEAGGKLTGSETTKKIREREREMLWGGNKALIIFGCSGNCTEEDAIRSRRVGQDWFWQKPIPGNDAAMIDIERAVCGGTAEEGKVAPEGAASKLTRRQFGRDATVFPG
jgi:signal transduction histidine kinase